MFLNVFNNTNWRVSFKLGANKLLLTSLPMRCRRCWKPIQSPPTCHVMCQTRNTGNYKIHDQNPLWIQYHQSVPQQLHVISQPHLTYFQLNDFELRKGKKLGVTISFNNHRLFVGNIPKNRDTDELLEEFSKHAREYGISVLEARVSIPEGTSASTLRSLECLLLM